jgi:hypothetical protein
MEKLRIVSDGTPKNTHVYCGDNEVGGIRALHLHIDLEHGCYGAIEVRFSELEMEAIKDRIIVYPEEEVKNIISDFVYDVEMRKFIKEK